MIKNRKEKVSYEQTTCESITCDVCKKEFINTSDNSFEIYEFMHLNKFCGYGSVFGDEEEIELDICQHCQKELFGKYVRIV